MSDSQTLEILRKEFMARAYAVLVNHDEIKIGESTDYVIKTYERIARSQTYMEAAREVEALINRAAKGSETK